MSFAINIANIENIVTEVKEKINSDKDVIRPSWEGQTADAFFNSINENDAIFSKIASQISSFSSAASVIDDLESLSSEVKTLMSKRDLAETDLDKNNFQRQIDLKNEEIKSKVKKALDLLSNVSMNSVLFNANDLVGFSEHFGSSESNITASVLSDEIYQEQISDAFSDVELNDKLNFKIRTVDPSWGTKFYTAASGNPYANANFSQCTCYAYGRFNEIASETGNKLFSGASFGNGGDFCFSNRTDRSNANAEGFNVTGASSIDSLSDLSPGDLLCWGKPGGAGHVGIVETVEEGKVMISNGNALSFNMVYKDIDHLKGFNLKGSYYLKGVVHQTKE